MKEDDICQIIAEKLDGVHPQLRGEKNAYKRAIARMAIKEYIKLEMEMMVDAFNRHG